MRVKWKLGIQKLASSHSGQLPKIYLQWKREVQPDKESLLACQFSLGVPQGSKGHQDPGWCWTEPELTLVPALGLGKARG